MTDKPIIAADLLFLVVGKIHCICRSSLTFAHCLGDVQVDVVDVCDSSGSGSGDTSHA